MIQRLIIILIVVLCTNLKAIAETQEVITPDGKATVTISDEESKAQTNEGIEVQAEKHGLAYEVLGRKLTKREKDSFGDHLSKEELKNTVLPLEQKLVIVRALTTVEAADSIKQVLDVYHISKSQTYSELVDYFSGLIEKYGSVKTGIESEYISNIKDDGEAFKKAASKAYETVFGVPEDKQNKDQIFAFLTQSNALTYSKMIQVLMQSITPEVRKQILFNALDQIGRPDLKTNDNFISKMLEQQFTYTNLMQLFKELKNEAPEQPAQGKDIQIQKK